MARRRAPDFNDGDFDTEDPAAYILANNQRALEQMIAARELVQLQQQVAECRIRNGVNAIKNCRELRLKYVDRVSNGREGVPPKGSKTDTVTLLRS